jgi:hypothetical protein
LVHRSPLCMQQLIRHSLPKARMFSSVILQLHRSMRHAIHQP